MEAIREQVMTTTAVDGIKYPKVAPKVKAMAELWHAAATKKKAKQCWTGLLESEDISALVHFDTTADLVDLRKLAKHCSLYSQGWGKLMRGRAAALGRLREIHRKSQKQNINSFSQRTILENFENDQGNLNNEESHQEIFFTQESSKKSPPDNLITKYFEVQGADGAELSRTPSHIDSRKRKGVEHHADNYSGAGKRRQEGTQASMSSAHGMGTELFRPDGQTQETQPSSQGDKTQEEYMESHRMEHRKRKRQRDLSAQARGAMDMELSEEDRQAGDDEDDDLQDRPAKKREGIGTRGYWA
jgi:hypothetical protein